MLHQLKLTNFRLFDDEVTIRFRPITVLIGRNSSGKSSIFKFILMLHQSLTDSGQQFLSPDGQYVNLGFFSDLRNSLTRKRNLTFELSMHNPWLEPDSSISEYIESVNRSSPIKHLGYNIKASISYSRNLVQGSAEYSLINLDLGRSYLTIKERLSENSSFVLPEIRLANIEAYDTTSLKAIRSVQAKLTRFSAEFTTMNELRQQLKSISHLSAVRAESQRVIVASTPPAGYVGQRGEYTLHHLQRIVAADQAEHSFIVPHIERVAGIRTVKFEASSGGYVARAFANNVTTGADVLVADYGFGVGQCLPIIVQGAIMNPYTSLMVEQPESQIHPTAQLALGSFFAELWKERQVASIIETHSDNVLLRLRRLIARGELSNADVSVAFFAFDENNRNMPVVRNLDIEEDGSMEPGLPMEFFGADVIEGLNLGART